MKNNTKLFIAITGSILVITGFASWLLLTIMEQYFKALGAAIDYQTTKKAFEIVSDTGDTVFFIFIASMLVGICLILIGFWEKLKN
jgi:hypothetical protein